MVATTTGQQVNYDSMTTDSYVGGATEREPHDALYNSIENLESVIAQLTWLKQKIIGDSEAVEPTPERPTPTLKYVLMNGSREIEDRKQHMINLIEEINGLLFSNRDEPPEPPEVKF